MSGETPVADRPRIREIWFEAGLAAVILVIAEIGIWAELDASRSAFPAGWGAYLIGVLVSGALVFRRRHALAVSAAILVLVLGYHLLGYPGQAPALALFVSLYSVAAYGRRVSATVVALVLVAVWGAIPFLPPHASDWGSWSVWGPVAGLVGAVAVGAVVRQSRTKQEADLERITHDAEVRMRESLVAERLVMARELHDVLAHTISAISVQSGVALDALEDEPAAAREAIAKVRSLARQAIPELRGTLELLRGETEGEAQKRPQPDLGRLEEVAGTAREAGLSVRLEVSLGGRSVPPAVELTAYRIAQEAVTNSVRHARATEVSIVVRVVGDDLAVEVVDNGSGPSIPSKPGLGLVGMGERAHSVGGTVQTGPARADSARADSAGHSGFRVFALLPIGAP